MDNVTATKTIIDRAAKAMHRRNRDGKPFRPVQDPLIQAASDLQIVTTMQAAEIERLKADLVAISADRDALVISLDANASALNEANATIAKLDAVVAAHQHDYAKPAQVDPADAVLVENVEA